MLRSWAIFIAVLLSSAFSFAAEKADLKIELKSLPGESINEHKINYKDLKGKVILVDFWATWCEPCKEALPHYSRLYKMYKSKGLVILAVNEDDSTADRDAFLKKTAVPFPVFADEGRKFLSGFNVEAIPTIFVFDKNMKPVTFYRGFDDKKAQALEKTVQELLNAK